MYNKYFKIVLDLLIALIIIIPLSLIGIVIAIAIRIDSKGSIFFKQNRLGKNGQIFEIYKFRTMIENAEEVGTGIFTWKDDPRITRVGNLLRKTSLDELPQIINIFRGEMSFVGPRPPVPYHPYKYQDYSEEQKMRFTVRPGITGLAQVSGRNKLTWDERIKYDVQYAKELSFALDIKIFVKTMLSVTFSRNIYSK